MKKNCEKNKSKAIEIFHELENGVLELCKCADVYALHIMAKLRNEQPRLNIINKIIDENVISSFNLLGSAYKADEIKVLQRNKNFKRIGEQILLSSYTALEIYLIEKFKEYYRHICSSTPSSIVEKTLAKFSFRSLDEIKGAYYEILDIHLPSFEIDYICTTDKANFEPKNEWEAICMLAKERNYITHSGKSKKYEITTLLDSWYPFEFIRKWIMLFDCNLDMFIYEKRETSLIKKYKRNRKAMGRSQRI